MGAVQFNGDVVKYTWIDGCTILADVYGYRAQKIDGKLRWCYEIAFNTGDIEKSIVAGELDEENADVQAAYVALVNDFNQYSDYANIREAIDELSPGKSLGFSKIVLPSQLELVTRETKGKNKPDKDQETPKDSGSMWGWFTILFSFLGTLSAVGARFGVADCGTYCPAGTWYTHALTAIDDKGDASWTTLPRWMPFSLSETAVTGWYILGAVSAILALTALYKWATKKK